MTKTLTAILVLATALAGSLPALAQDATPHGQPEFVGVDLDNGSVYYNGRNSGRYCLYRTVQRYTISAATVWRASVPAWWRRSTVAWRAAFAL